VRVEHQAEGALAGGGALPTLFGACARPRQDGLLAPADGPAVPGGLSTKRPAAEGGNEVLDDEKPVEVLARGDYRRIATLIAELEYPGAS
jgi:hypothetical protein